MQPRDSVVRGARVLIVWAEAVVGAVIRARDERDRRLWRSGSASDTQLEVELAFLAGRVARCVVHHKTARRRGGEARVKVLSNTTRRQAHDLHGAPDGVRVRAQALAAREYLPLDRTARIQSQVPAARGELAHTDVVITDVTKAVAVRSSLGWVGVVRAVVRGVGHAVAVPIRVARVADSVAIDVALRRVHDGRTVVGAGAQAARRARVADAVQVRVHLRL